MNNISAIHIVGIIIALALITCAGVYSGKKVSTAKDFLNPNGLSVGLVVGSLMGAIVGGSVTIGTAQSAFVKGYSGVWFTVGAFFLAIVFNLMIKRIKSGSAISKNIATEFGMKTGTVLNVLSLLSFGISIFSQMASSAALFHSIFGVEKEVGIIISSLMMIVIVIFGGVWASGIAGLLKTILIALTVIFSGILAVVKSGGLAELHMSVPSANYLSLFPTGVIDGLSSGIVSACGMFVTHTYLQAMLSAKNNRTAQSGACIAGILTPFIGFAAAAIGIFMRVNYPEMTASDALPNFLLLYYPKLISGFCLGTLFIAVIVSGGVLALSMCTITLTGIVPETVLEKSNPKRRLALTRSLVLVYILIPTIISLCVTPSLILNVAFLAVSVRAAILLVPYLITLFLPGRVSGIAVSIASCVGVGIVIIGGLAVNLKVNPLFIAVLVEIIIISLIMTIMRRKNERTN